MVRDSEKLREVLTANYPGLQIQSIAKSSGQRIVYFARFNNFERVEAEETVTYEWQTWGTIALKVSDGSSGLDVARMQAEIIALSGIKSDFYPKLYHSELLSFNPYTEEPLTPKLFVTIEEYIPSVPLSEKMDHFGSEKKVIRLMLDMISALSLLWNHPKRYVHRDIKPANILVKADDSIVIIDLGIIRESGTTGITKTYMFIGPCSPGFASPEQLINDKKNISFKSDLFSLGTLAYTLLTGENPFFSGDEGVEEIIESTCTYHPPPLKELHACSENLSDIIERMMEKPPYRRPRNLKNLVNSLENLWEP